MKKEITEFYCDVCGKKVKESELIVRYLPVRLFDSEGVCTEYTQEKKFEVCEECRKAYEKILFDKFAYIKDCYGISVEVKYKRGKR